jgi:FkbM family methyltransferase
MCGYRRKLDSSPISFAAILRIAERFGLTTGIYVDAGAYHPIFGSNTLLLHKQGWRGINIDLAPERIAEFKNYRPNDHNVVACLSDGVTEAEIAHYEIPSSDRVVFSGNSEKLSIVGGKPVRFSTATTTTLTEIIEKSPFHFEQVEYLDIDCEGSDLAILRGVDFDRCRPRILSVEAFDSSERDTMIGLLARHGYHLEVLLPPTALFVRE